MIRLQVFPLKQTQLVAVLHYPDLNVICTFTCINKHAYLRQLVHHDLYVKITMLDKVFRLQPYL